MKTFSEFLTEEDEQQSLTEASLLSKGFVFSQLQRCKSARQKMHQKLSNMKSDATADQRDNDLEEKINKLADAIEVLTYALYYQAEMSMHIMNSIAADNLLSTNLSKLVKQLSKK